MAIAHFYDAYNTLNSYLNLDIDNKVITNAITKIIKLMLPFTPHIAHELLELLKCRSKDKWPKIKKELLNEVKFAIQVNGKTRDVITLKKDLLQAKIENVLTKNSKVNKYISGKKIIKTIFVKNKILNFIIK